MAEKHVRYGGSSASMWKNCAGWAGLVAQLPKRPVGRAAHEGTAQHACMERLLKDPDLTPEKFFGTKISTEGGPIEITVAHVDAIGVALQAYEDILDTFGEDAVVMAEKFVSTGNEDEGGSLDAAITDRKRAAIIDFKFGQMEVGAESDQGFWYAACARHEMPDLFGKVVEWENYIIQPAYDPAVDVVKFPVGVLDRFEQEARTAIDMSKGINPHYVEGDWCTWCDGKLACPAKVGRLKTLTAPNHIMDLQELGRQWSILKGWDKWREEAEQRLLHELEHGHQNQHVKLVNKRAVRQWTVEAAAVKKFKSRKVAQDRYMVTKLISPAQAEEQRLLTKAEVKELANPVSSGHTIALMSSKAPAVMPTGALKEALKRR
jgi:hypothetical protein